MTDLLKKIVVRYSIFLAFVYNLLNRNSRHVWGGNLLVKRGVFMKRTSINVKGKNNTILIENGLTRLRNCKIVIMGNNNHLTIESGCKLTGVSFYIEDSGGCIHIGKDTIITGTTHLAVIEGTSISIGAQCLFSQNITLRTGDSHSILDSTGKRINPSKNIIIGNHVWVGNTVIILKGTKINDNCVVATGSIITGNDCPPNSVIGGIGGRVLKNDINWCGERIPIQK